MLARNNSDTSVRAAVMREAAILPIRSRRRQFLRNTCLPIPFPTLFDFFEIGMREGPAHAYAKLRQRKPSGPR
jgi:hypothetical protein